MLCDANPGQHLQQLVHVVRSPCRSAARGFCRRVSSPSKHAERPTRAPSGFLALSRDKNTSKGAPFSAFPVFDMPNTQRPRGSNGCAAHQASCRHSFEPPAFQDDSRRAHRVKLETGVLRESVVATLVFPSVCRYLAAGSPRPGQYLFPRAPPPSSACRTMNECVRGRMHCAASNMRRGGGAKRCVDTRGKVLVRL